MFSAGQRMSAASWSGLRTITTGVSGSTSQPSEYTAGHLPAATHVELGDLPGKVDAVPSGGAVVMCGHGERAITAASLLDPTGRDDLAVLVGGADDWATATGRRLEEGA